MRRCCARRRSRCRCGGSTKSQPPVTPCCASGSRRTARAAPEAPAVPRGPPVSIVKVLPELRAGGGAQMAFDTGLLETADEVIARRYTWAPPALSLGKFQKYEPLPGVPFDVVRRPSGGRAVLHGEGFEWSFAVAFPAGTLLGEPWQGDGLAGAGYVLAPEMIWKRVLVRLEAALQHLVV